MKKRHPSIDGFIPRRSGANLGEDVQNNTQNVSLEKTKNGPFYNTGQDAMQRLGKRQSGLDIVRSDIDESLKEIDTDQEPAKKLSRHQRRRIKKMAKRPKNRIRRIFKRIAILLLVLIIAAGGYMAYKFIIAGGNIFEGGIFGLLDSRPLKQDRNGRSNFLILGTSEDDPGHGGADLTDSMLVASIDQKNKNIYMFSVPRDLYVKYGAACISGYSGKINAYFSCANDGTTKEAEQDRLTKTQKLVGDIFGLDIQYSVHVNHSVIKEAVDAVGGVDVDIQGSNGETRGVLDRNFDWRCNYTCYLVKYSNGIHHLDGKHALYLSMARGDVAETYGLADSNFDREINQQKILIALKEKAMSTGTLTNLSTVTKLIDSFGNNLRTNIQSNEIRTLMQISSDVKSKDIHTISLFNDGDSVVKTGAYGGASVVMPLAGIYDYTDIQSFINKKLSKDPLVRESAPIVVLNGTGRSGFGQLKADEFTKMGLNVVNIDNAPSGTYGTVEIYQIGNDNSATASKLASKFKVTLKKTTPPILVDDSVRFVIIFGPAGN